LLQNGVSSSNKAYQALLQGFAMFDGASIVMVLGDSPFQQMILHRYRTISGVHV
jgi:hypothetical protein